MVAFPVLLFFLFIFFHLHFAYTFNSCGLRQVFLVELSKSLRGGPSSRMAGDELLPLPLRLLKTKDRLPSPHCSTLAPSTPTSPSASTPLGVAPSPLPELRYETTQGVATQMVWGLRFGVA